MAESTAKASKDTASEAQARFVISLPRELGAKVDQVGSVMTAAMREQTKLTIELSRSQVVQTLILSALEEYESAATDDNGDTGK